MELDLGRDIILKNKGSFVGGEDLAEKKQSLKNELREFSRFLDSRQPEDISPEMREKLEKNRIEEHELDSRILEIKEDMVEYFRKAAVSEGLTTNDEKMDFKIIFVDPDYFEKSDMTGGFMPPENLIVVGYGKITDQFDIFQISTTIFHELRHAVSQRKGVIYLGGDNPVVSEKGLPYNKVDIVAGMDRMSGVPINDLLEEIYVEGYVFERIQAIENKDFQDSIEFTKKKSVEQNYNPRLMTTFKRSKSDHEKFAATEYTHILQLFLAINRRIPNFTDLCADVRSGKAGARNTLAGELIKHFDKDILALLLTSKVSEAMLIKEIVAQHKK